MSVAPDEGNSGVVDRLDRIRTALRAAEIQHGRPVEAAQLVAVSKFFDADAVLPVLEAGQRRFGENRVQEAKAKWSPLRDRYPDVDLHLIGPLQSNKAADAVALFDAIQTVDREKIAAELSKEIARQNRAPKLFVQVNTGEEPQKAGVAPGNAAAFVSRCRDAHGLVIAGLMCIPPDGEAPGPHFALLQKLGRECGVSELSMGMSGDFETAVGFGATLVRVGSAIFGARPAAAG